jgi:hypothetical protein
VLSAPNPGKAKHHNPMPHRHDPHTTRLRARTGAARPYSICLTSILRSRGYVRRQAHLDSRLGAMRVANTTTIRTGTCSRYRSRTSHEIAERIVDALDGVDRAVGTARRMASRSSSVLARLKGARAGPSRRLSTGRGHDRLLEHAARAGRPPAASAPGAPDRPGRTASAGAAFASLAGITGTRGHGCTRRPAADLAR